MTLFERDVASPSVSFAALLSGQRPPIQGETAVSLETYANEIIASGFPGLRHLTGRARRAQLDGYIQRIVERDFEDFGHRIRNPAALRRWMTAYAAATSTTASYETIRDAAIGGKADNLAKTTTQPYRDTLERLWIIDSIPAWQPVRNQVTRLTAPPKHHLADPALAARCLALTSMHCSMGRRWDRQSRGMARFWGTCSNRSSHSTCESSRKPPKPRPGICARGASYMKSI